MAYHWLKMRGDLDLYGSYLNRTFNRWELYERVPERVVRSVINEEISDETLPSIFRTIDTLLDNRRLDLIIGGPPCQAYSLVGRSRDQLGMKIDARNYLYRHYARFLQKIQTLVFRF